MEEMPNEAPTCHVLDAELSTFSNPIHFIFIPTLGVWSPVAAFHEHFISRSTRRGGAWPKTSARK